MTGRQRLAWALIGVGAVLVVVGAIGALASNGGKSSTVATATAATTPTTTRPASSTTITQPPTTTAVSAMSSTTTTAPTTTTIPATTTTEPASDLILAFAQMFAAALDADDADFAFDRMHPVVLSLFDADLCRSYAEREIVLIEGYTITPPVEGPTRQVFQTPDGEIGVDVYTAAVSFTFQGEDVETTGSFALVGDEVRWFTNCR